MLSVVKTERLTPEARKSASILETVRDLLESLRDARVVVVGTTCTGKSTLLEHLPGAQDMDEIVFPTLSKEERDYVCQTPWTPEIGATMERLVKERVKVEAGSPVFGTVVLDSDYIVQLDISDELLAERTAARDVAFEDAKQMQAQINHEVELSNIPVIYVTVG